MLQTVWCHDVTLHKPGWKFKAYNEQAQGEEKPLEHVLFWVTPDSVVINHSCIQVQECVYRVCEHKTSQ